MTWPGSEVSILIENGGSNEGIIGTSTPIEGADYRNGFDQVPGGAQLIFKKGHSVFPQNRFFQEAGAASGTGLVQQTVQIVAALRLRDLTLFVRASVAHWDRNRLHSSVAGANNPSNAVACFRSGSQEG